MKIGIFGMPRNNKVVAKKKKTKPKPKEKVTKPSFWEARLHRTVERVGRSLIFILFCAK